MTTLETLLTSGGLIALGAVLGTVLGGFITNWLGAKRDQRKYAHEQTMAEQARRHEQAMADKARRQQRLEQAYLELLGYLSYRAAWARSVRPMLGPVEAPDPLPREEVQRVEALVEAHGSQEVRRLLREWRARAVKIQDADLTIRIEEGSQRPSQQLQDDARREHLAIEGYREAMFEAAEAIRERVRQELAGEV